MSFPIMRNEGIRIADDDIAANIMKLHEGGADILFSRSHSGEAKIKIRYGPFKWRTVRYTVNDKTALLIRNMMRSRINFN